MDDLLDRLQAMAWELGRAWEDYPESRPALEQVLVNSGLEQDEDGHWVLETPRGVYQVTGRTE